MLHTQNLVIIGFQVGNTVPFGLELGNSEFEKHFEIPSLDKMSELMKVQCRLLLIS